MPPASLPDKESAIAKSDFSPLNHYHQPLTPARPRAAELVQEVIDGFRHATRMIEPGTARDILRSYGITFETLEGETPEPGDVPAEPAAPTPPQV